MQQQKSDTHNIVASVRRALQRARIAILTVALTYLVSVSVGIVMVHTGNEWAITYRDRIVSGAQSSPSIIALKQNDRLRAAILDFGGNLYGAIADTLGGLGVLFPYPFMAYRGWIGGIVSIDSSHVSRFAEPREAMYYLITLTLQLIPYVLSGGAGVNMGLALYRPRSFYQGEKWLGIPKEALRDVFRIYLLVVPLFLLASLWEFFER
ncbi:MAG TPA: stage II sporulation protein M [Anaerolineales bacterium]|nr:stage II sporulation protein M [Anaerolineales bacterium]